MRFLKVEGRRAVLLLPGVLAALLSWIAVAAAAQRESTGALEIQVVGISSKQGEIGCALYRSANGFPMDPSKAVQTWQPASPGRVTCRFDGLAPGTYAVALSHDLNGNRITDTNFIGLPKEAWGVTNNGRPSMRAPRFDEAGVAVAAGETVTQTVRIAK